MNTTKNATSVLQNSMLLGTDADVLITLNKAKRESTCCEKSLKEICSRLKEVVLVFSPDQGLQMFLGSMKEMGKLSVSHQAVQVPPQYNVRADTILLHDGEITENADNSGLHTLKKNQKEGGDKIDPDLKLFIPSPSITPVTTRHNIQHGKLDGSFRVRTAQDRDNCCIVGLACLNDGRIVLADQMHRKVKLYDGEYRWISERVLSARPFDVTSVSSSEIAVSLPREKRFLLMQVICRV